jgi:hypothetical protein
MIAAVSGCSEEWIRKPADENNPDRQEIELKAAGFDPIEASLMHLSLPEPNKPPFELLFDRNGRQAFGRASDRLWLNHYNVPMSYAKQFAEAEDEKGNPLFSSGLWTAMFHAAGVDISYAKPFASVKDKKGSRRFTDYDIIRFRETGVSLEEAVAFAGRGFNPKETYRFKQLGISLEEALAFRDTEKPNALLVYPMDDSGAFENKAAIGIYSRIKEVYDVKTVIAATKKDVYAAIDKTPDIELLVLGGHGTSETLTLGEDRKNEQHRIGISDIELGEYIRKLSIAAVIVLDSCRTAQGGGEGKNLANFVAGMSEGRKVIAAYESYGSSNVVIISIYPFDMDIIVDGRSVAYKKAGNME